MQNPKYIMNRLIIIIKLKEIINLTKSPWFKILYKKYINPLKDVKQEKNPVNKISWPEWLNLLFIKKPTKNEPSIEIIKLLSIKNLKNVPRYDAARIYIILLIFTL